jgi:hypothetical protein
LAADGRVDFGQHVIEQKDRTAPITSAEFKFRVLENGAYVRQALRYPIGTTGALAHERQRSRGVMMASVRWPTNMGFRK